MMSSNEEVDPIIDKIKKIYEGYGIDTSDMEEEEFERIKRDYLSKGSRLLDMDVREAEEKQDSSD